MWQSSNLCRVSGLFKANSVVVICAIGKTLFTLALGFCFLISQPRSKSTEY